MLVVAPDDFPVLGALLEADFFPKNKKEINTCFLKEQPEFCQQRLSFK